MYLSHNNPKNYYVIDVEANSLYPDVLHCIVVENYETNQVWEFYGPDLIHELRRFVETAGKDAIWVGHNFISWDRFHVGRLGGVDFPADRIVDTLVLSYLYDPQMVKPRGYTGKAGPHSLEAWGYRLGLAKPDHEDWAKFSPEMLNRCRGDVKLTKLLFQKLTKRMKARGYSEESCELEHLIRPIVDQQERNGFYFDIPKAEALYNHLRNKEAVLTETVRGLFPQRLEPIRRYEYRTKQNGQPHAHYLRHLETYPELRFNDDHTEYTVFDYVEFNLGSPQQRVKRLLELGYKPTKFTPTGQPKVDEETLVDFAEESGHDAVRALADFLVVNGRGNMVNTWLQAVNRDDSCIHGKVFSCGAGTRRMRHTSPNTANIPQADPKVKYGREVRELWRARPDRILVGHDAKACQMRLFAHYLPDPEMGRRYWDTDVCADPHQYNADLIGIPRKPVKNVFYAFLFGAANKKLGNTAEGRDAKFGKWIRGRLYEITPGLEDLSRQCAANWERDKGWLHCIDGGWVRCPSPHAALNYYLQSAEGIIMKRATLFITERAQHLDYLKVGDIHDEGQDDVAPRDADEFGRIAVEAIRDAGDFYNLKVPMDGDYKIGQTWADTH